MLLTEYRLDLVIRALRSILPLEHPADATLRHFFQHERIGSKERALVAETIFGVLRHRLFLEQACAQEATPRRMTLAYWIRFGGYNLRELEPLLMHGESSWLGQVKAISLATLPLPVQAELPEWVIEQLQPTMSDEMILALGRSMQSPAPLDLRVNTLLATRDEVLQTFQSEGMDALPTPYSPIGIRLKNKPALAGHPLFLSGKIEVQDEGSQLLGYLLAPKRSDMVVDFCAGAGGKTLMLGAMMQSQGRLYALDVSEKRLANLKPRLKRSGLSNLHPQLISHENDSRIKRLYGKIDRVLVDAPCSGLGTSRRNPDIKFRQSPESVTGYTRMQASILASASKLLKPGGRLVYATCSFLPQENHAIIDAFLTEHPAFIQRPAGEILAQNKIPMESKTFLQLLPSLHGTDAFFAAVLERVKTTSPQEI
ncbi:RsmB/NOP family class I SAM-dependent RNA methyltransferase [Candidatus Nitrotoga fabula]|uniref:Fmu (Sun) domain protein n=1 Tax=Candidatus Nitrotoga fabula TaxID=2182327 RepID=A0A916BE31_9PROT|nr:RsmB/NOP family class I SAM-dependent RNA methyltransferase [Candidatus Nitrotoga fabula]CAE6741182.1 Fmu (Sun) domain protein [Candidatus Nitrotoga fabula]